MKAFLSYSHRDAEAVARLRTHMAMLRRDGTIQAWYDRKLLAGDSFEDVIDAHLEDCALFLAIVSPDFLASDYCYEREMRHALERHQTGLLRVVPIILRPCEWRVSPLGKLNALPKDGRPVTEWSNEDSAFDVIVREIRRIAAANTAPTLRQLAGPQPMAAPTQPPTTGGGYQVPRRFDDIDRAQFRDATFAVVSARFEGGIAELERQGVRGHYALDGSSFNATLVTDGPHRQHTTRIAVYATSNTMLGDITWAFGRHASPNSVNGAWTIESDDYEPYLRSLMPLNGGDGRLTQREAAEALWREYLSQAGIKRR